MEEAEGTQYWCHMCSQTVNPIIEIDTMKCPICQSGFVEEMATAASPGNNDSPLDFQLPDRALSLWAPILLGMMGNSRRGRRMRRIEFEDENDDDTHQPNDDETEFDREIDSIMRRRRRNSATLLRLLQDMRAGIISESGNFETDEGTGDRDDNDRDRERVILINPFNQTIVVRGSHDQNNESQNRAPIGSLGDYFVGPGLDLLLQHLSENDPNRYGTPPAQKEAIEALPKVKVEETLQCSVCLDDCEIGTEVREMPCKHKFHGKCLWPWLELHSSCPVCRYQLPCDESKLDSEGSRNNINEEGNNNGDDNVDDGGDDRNENGRQFSVPLPWPFSSLFSSSTSRSNGGNATSSGSSANANPSTSREDEN